MHRRGRGLAVLWLILSLHGVAPRAQEDSLHRFAIEPGRDWAPLPNQWSFNPEDDPRFAQTQWDDSLWRRVDARLLAEDLPADWDGRAWFRFRFEVDPQWEKTPLGLLIDQRGAAEIYLDGQLLLRIGEIAAEASAERTERRYAPYVFSFQERPEHLLAVRFSNSRWKDYHAQGAFAGFRFSIWKANAVVDGRMGMLRYFNSLAFFFLGVFGAFGTLHLLLFAFYPKGRENLYFGLFSASVAAVVFVVLERRVTTSLEFLHLYSFRLQNILGTIVLAATLLFMYQLFYRRQPRWRALIVLSAAVLVVYSLLDIQRAAWLFLAAAIAASAEELRVVGQAIYRRRPGAWIVGLGLAALALSSGYIMVAETGFLPLLEGRQELIPFASLLVLVFGMSVFLSRRFARTAKNLRKQLKRVKRLSKQKVVRERRLRKVEMRRQRLESEYRQKVKELEEARELQLSMLPKDLPQLPHLDLAAYMKTATEVGGDYYDFELEENGVLTVAVGDATGHGMKAGTMVTAAKTLFGVFGKSARLSEALKKSTQALKRLNLKRLYMAMALARFENGSLRVASAGMPPVLIYRAVNGELEELLLPAAPLGSFVKFPYRETAVPLKPGDAVLLMSDGFPELFNDQGEMLGYEQAAEAFRAVGSMAAGEIVEGLVEAGERWSQNRPADDDVTFVVIKVKADAPAPA